MRETADPQGTFEANLANWKADPELAQIGSILENHPSLCTLVAGDLAPEERVPSAAVRRHGDAVCL